jgi:polar amino acid transport system substrate-binding protein
MNFLILKLVIILNLISYAIFGGIALAAKEKIVLAADYWCPYNCDPKDKNPGYLVELAQKAFEIYGIDVEYKLMSWSDALNAAVEGHINGVIGFSNESPELLLPQIPQAYSIISTFTRKDSNWVYYDIESLSNNKITLIQDNYMGDLVLQYFTVNYPMHPELFLVETGDYAVANAINNLLEGKADIYLEDEKVANYYIINNNLSSYIKNSGRITEGASSPIFIAFSPKCPRSVSYIKMLEDATQSLNDTGELSHLQRKYEVIIGGSN